MRAEQTYFWIAVVAYGLAAFAYLLGLFARSEKLFRAGLVVSAGGESLCVQGVAAPGTAPRLTRIAGFHVDVPPRRTLIVLTNRDVPGVIGRVGTLLGESHINIASYHQSRLAQGGEALAAISVDDPVPDEVRRRLLQLPDVRSATTVTFR